MDFDWFDPQLHTPDNAALLGALHSFRENPSHETRTRFYQELLRSELLVLNAGQGANPAEPAGGISLITAFDEKREPVLPAFTGGSTLSAMRRPEDGSIGLGAVELCQLAQANGLQQMVLDPGTDHMTLLNGYELQELAKGMIPVSETAPHRLNREQEISISAALETAPNSHFRELLVQALPGFPGILAAYIFYLGRPEGTPSLTLGFRFLEGTDQKTMTEILNALFEHAGPALGPDDLLNVMPLTDPKMIDRLNELAPPLWTAS